MMRLPSSTSVFRSSNAGGPFWVPWKLGMPMRGERGRGSNSASLAMLAAIRRASLAVHVMCSSCSGAHKHMHMQFTKLVWRFGPRQCGASGQ